MTELPIPVQVGTEPPASWDAIEAPPMEVGKGTSLRPPKKPRPALASTTLDWDALGLEPRWLGFDTVDCAAALQPSIFTGQGAHEFDRFRQGAENRGEMALVVCRIGAPEGGSPRSVLTPYDDSIHLGRIDSSIRSRPLGVGAAVRGAANLGSTDKQLALRLLNCNPAPLWRSLSLVGMTLETGRGIVEHPAQGTLVPSVETELGEPVVAVWISSDDVERRYIVPAESPWPVVLQWLIEQALPEYVPGAMHRARRQLAHNHNLMTRRERDARAALTDLEANYLTRHATLQRELEDAQAAASTVRVGLLYGTGKPLVDAVREVLESAGVTVRDLDETLGGTKNADLLCTYGGHSRLVEVKSAIANAPERAYQDLVRHLREWGALPGNTPVEGGALVMNHQRRAAPQERSRKPYGRPEFLAAQAEPVFTTLCRLP